MTEMIFCSKTTHSRYDNSRHMNILHFFATLSRIVLEEFTMLLIFFIVSWNVLQSCWMLRARGQAIEWWRSEDIASWIFWQALKNYTYYTNYYACYYYYILVLLLLHPKTQTRIDRRDLGRKKYRRMTRNWQCCWGHKKMECIRQKGNY